MLETIFRKLTKIWSSEERIWKGTPLPIIEKWDQKSRTFYKLYPAHLRAN